GGGRGQPGVAGGAEAPAGLVHDGRPVRAGDLGGTVGGAVVDDECAPARWDAFEHPGKGLGLVQAGKHHVDVFGRSRGHGLTLRTRRVHIGLLLLTKRRRPMSGAVIGGAPAAARCQAGGMQQQPYEAPAGRGADGSPRVLAVDDAPTVAEVGAEYLDRAGYVLDRPGGGRASLAAGRTGRTWSCSISCCPAWTAWRCAGGSAGTVPCRSSCSPPAGTRRTASWVWRSVPTTTSPSRSVRASWCCAWSRCCAAAGPPPRAAGWRRPG